MSDLHRACCSGDLLGFIGALGTGPTTFWYALCLFLCSAKLLCLGPPWGEVQGLTVSHLLCRLPSIIWLVLKKPTMQNWNWWASWFCIILGILVTIVGSIGGMRGIIIDASGGSPHLCLHAKAYSPVGPAATLQKGSQQTTLCSRFLLTAAALHRSHGLTDTCAKLLSS